MNAYLDRAEELQAEIARLQERPIMKYFTIARQARLLSEVNKLLFYAALANYYDTHCTVTGERITPDDASPPETKDSAGQSPTGPPA